MSKKLGYLEGLRGLACLIVVLDHCVNSFLPEARFTNFDGRFSGIYRMIASSPLNFIYSGATPVLLFFILSGFVLSKKFIETGDGKILARGSIKRYFRLLGPVLTSSLAMYVSIKYAASMGILDASQYTLSNTLYQSFIGAFIDTKPLINSPLWTMRFEFIGSLIVFALLALANGHSNKKYIYYLVMVFFVSIGGDAYLFSLFIFGLICANDNTKNCGIAKIQAKPLVFILFAASVWLSTYPFPRPNVDTLGMYSYLTIAENKGLSHTIWHYVGAILLFASIINSKILKNFFSLKPFVYIGKISFSIYVLHEVVIFNVVNYVHPSFSRELNFLVMTSIVVAISVVISIPFERYVDSKSVKASNLITAKV
ncbi:hypothetical protein C6668_08745 [Escherichia coli]|uniref:acyltransferase family protein n=1 Tax=Escherichia coli TaxID=562 RepID=UPI000D0BA08E|nr:acyltransferase [Escherichia coli]EFN8569724.1 acyltransferase [Escherichia coli O85:H32]AVS06500.1 hypothetical protein C6668_08745 [Escherichia coli]EEU9387928.1 acyltransferase family protein [Escherichia coli]EFC9797999.1 acyltransferase [Escherichia coli]EFH4449042.1 acyltransferase family protein [Escherichia coli]